MHYLLTTAPVAPGTITAAEATGVSVLTPRLSLDEIQALVPFACLVAGYALMTLDETRQYLSDHAAAWELPTEDIPQ